MFQCNQQVQMQKMDQLNQQLQETSRSFRQQQYAMPQYMAPQPAPLTQAGGNQIIASVQSYIRTADIDLMVPDLQCAPTLQT
jgi:hypothetical protein